MALVNSVDVHLLEDRVRRGESSGERNDCNDGCLHIRIVLVKFELPEAMEKIDQPYN